MNRREFVRTAGGAAGAAATLGTAGTAAAQEEGGGGNGSSGGGGGGNTAPDYGNWFSNVGNFAGPGSTVDETGSSEVTVTVGAQGNGGAFAFAPPAVHVDNGATVKWEWTGNGGGHNVLSEGEGPLDSGSTVSSAGVHYEYTFEEDGIYKYFCSPHRGNGMKGAIVVGSEYPTTNLNSGVQEVNPHEAGVPIQPHYVGFGAGLAVIIPLIFTFFQLKYGESPHTSGGNN
ncbi:halocyanin domain-containing protein [Halomicroarcula limicola]|uniref:Halocyanin domain-containing protein n=1 Tax=Haloarcula limicola TaxID=1429915 RepID=A0A8J8C3Y4_9EURY|nr:halocyanin domain-containing protein [Halomicroarcula limicola]MBV0923549.1 halocyanin domain-containing protein [Halomicroarcula limicola]